MPFDGTKAPDTAVYLERRENAAHFWRGVPAERLEMATWVTCALGHLASAGIDGWGYVRFVPPPSWGDEFGYKAAAVYFGLKPEDAFDTFSSHCSSYGKSRHEMTPGDVADRLLSLPVTPPA